MTGRTGPGSDRAPAGGVAPAGEGRPSPALYAGVVGQGPAVAALRAAAATPVHAYLLVGPPGSGKRALARGFSASLVCPNGGDATCRHCRLALAGEHPDVVVFQPEGAFLRREDATEITRLAVRSPVEGPRKVLVLTDFERIQVAGPALLKTVEEPPESTVFVILATSVPPELVTIASRCVRIDVAPLSAPEVRAVLEAEGVAPDRAASAATGAVGNLERARLLASDPALDARRRAWRDVPSRVDGTGAAVAATADALVALLDDAAAPVAERHDREVAEAAERAERTGERGGAARRELDARHRRERRRHRTDELRFGLATVAARYRDAVEAAARRPGAAPDVAEVLAALRAVQAAAEALPSNPNEVLLLQALILRLPPLPPDGPPGAGW